MTKLTRPFFPIGFFRVWLFRIKVLLTRAQPIRALSIRELSIRQLTRGLIVALTIAPSIALLPVAAMADIDQDDAIRLKQAGEILPLETILKTARQHHDGKVIGVELEREHNILIYEIKILDDNGELWEIKVNAKDGRLLQQEEDD